MTFMRLSRGVYADDTTNNDTDNNTDATVRCVLGDFCFRGVLRDDTNLQIKLPKMMLGSWVLVDLK